jgi:thiol:disulfide interchange protein DsbD
MTGASGRLPQPQDLDSTADLKETLLPMMSLSKLTTNLTETDRRLRRRLLGWLVLSAVLGGPAQALDGKDLLPAEQAFRIAAQIDRNEVRFGWDIADGYYLYRKKFKFAPKTPGIEAGEPVFPEGKVKHDEFFGDMEIYRHHVDVRLPLIYRNAAPESLTLEVTVQGCADAGVCYPPFKRTLDLSGAMAATGSDTSTANPTASPAAPAGKAAGECEIGPATGSVETPPPSEQCRIFNQLNGGSLWLTVASFLGMGVLLAFTPCIFPMIPILSGIVAGHGHAITTRRAFFLSLSYVLASALAYAGFGVLAGLFGGNLQATFQEPWVIVAFSALFVVLALSMFGVFTLQVPGFIQSRVAVLSNRQRGGTLAGAAAMGALSALIVGPCVAAPLAGALIYIGQTGDALLGFLALFALGLGMGVPLLAIGASAGTLLPRAGVWMNAVKAGFGVGLLGIAVWLLERILPASAAMFLWALWLIIPAIYLGALEALPQSPSGWRKLWKGIGIVMLCYGVLLLIGVASNGGDPLQPLRGLPAATAGTTSPALAFRKIRSIGDLDREIAAAEAAGHWVMLDFYADWCVSCKEMERYTFADGKVRSALSQVVVLQADVTANSAEDQALLRKFSLVGPPATLFFGPDRAERKPFRVVGYMEAEAFLSHLRKIIGVSLANI